MPMTIFQQGVSAKRYLAANSQFDGGPSDE
jgi:hypothetical protein